MIRSRRQFLKTAASTTTFTSVPLVMTDAGQRKETLSPDQILELFEHLPGDKGLKDLIPKAEGTPEFSVQIIPDQTLFAASAIKTFALCVALQQAEQQAEQADSLDIDSALEAK